MGEAQRQELVLFDIEQKPRKKATGGARKGGAAASRASAPKAKTAVAAKASGAKPAAKPASAKSGAKASAAKAASKPAAKAAGAKTAAKPAAKTAAAPRKKPVRKPAVEENPVALRSLKLAEAGEKPQRKPRPADGAKPRPVRSEKPRVNPEGRVEARQEAYDEYDLPPRPARKKGGGKKRRRKKSGFSGVSLLLLLMVLGLAGVGAWRVQAYGEFQQMKAVVSRQTFYQGTTVEGMDVSQLTLTQALEYWRDQVEPGYSQRTVELNDGTQVTAAQLGYESNYAQVLTSAWNAGRSGSLLQRYRNLESAVARPEAHRVSRSMYDEGRVQEYAAAAAEQVDREPQDAKLKSFNTENFAFEFESEQNGYRLNQAALVRDIQTALNAGGGEVTLDIETLRPSVTRENVSAQYGMITNAVTNASSSRSSRLSNIKLSLELINGTALKPGESFSFNEVVGQRTRERGFKTATAYSSGKVTEEVGGGICQVSTTLFNAAVKADLKITERHPHSLTVSYVDLGKDAAVDWGNKDLKFTNNTDDTIYICCYLTDNERVNVGIFGKLLPDGQTITVESEKTGTVDYETEYQMSFELFSGQTKVIQQGKKGAKAVAYKVWHDAQGNEIRREELAKSRYQATDEIIAYGP